ncbi:protein THALLO isoform X2 [Rosa rugosa]|uniref:protein THALLO isoform X2 n=1 Tax=Rosa rugosa TaxID=74645 RepID=UPI002B408205|nr:protein THALLO isoform X2 [Rosa rugosa]
MGKRGKSTSQRKGHENPTKTKLHAVEDDMDDEVDAFMKQRDIVPLDLNQDVTDSDEDDEQTVFDLQNVNDDEEEEEEDDDDIPDTGMAAKIVRQQKFMRAKFGGVEDEMLDEEEEEEEEEEKPIWGGRRPGYHGGDNRDFEEKSSGDDSAEEEAREAERIRREKAKSSTREDFGLEDDSEDESNRESTFEEMSVHGKSEKKSRVILEVADDMGTAYEEVKKDLNALSKEEQLSVLNNTAPELVGLLAELNDALEELENRVDPILIKVRRGEVMMEGGMRYLEVKQLLLLAYSQAITFYLLLKSEGQQVRDHPVLARLVDIKSLLDKMKQLDENLPSDLEEIINKYNGMEAVVKSVKENAAKPSDTFAKGCRSQLVSLEPKEAAVWHNTVQMEKVKSLKDDEKVGKRKRQSDEVGSQSMKMLKVRAALEEKLKQKGVFNSITPRTDRPQKHLKPLNGKLESYDDFDDDPVNAEGANQGHASSLSASKVSQLVAANRHKSKIVSGDDDLPQRDDIGERRRKHELRVLAGAGIRSEDDAGENDTISDDGDIEMEDSEAGDSEDDFYEQAKQNRAAKLAAKADIHSRSSVPSLPETVDGKRHITYQMEKNRGLTRARKKLIKNPRKKYKLKHEKKMKNRKGQVREVKKPIGPYGGETSGINPRISRSTRFKN